MVTADIPATGKMLPASGSRLLNASSETPRKAGAEKVTGVVGELADFFAPDCPQCGSCDTAATGFKCRDCGYDFPRDLK